MTNVVKNGVVMAARDKNQLAAFLNNGWTVAEAKATVPNPVAKETAVTEPETKPPIEGGATSKYTKTDINRMSAAGLKGLAKSVGIDGADNMSGQSLKTVLIEKLGL